MFLKQFKLSYASIGISILGECLLAFVVFFTCPCFADDLDKMLENGREQLNMGSFESALKVFKLGLQPALVSGRKKDIGDFNYYAGVATMELKDYVGAVKYLEQALDSYRSANDSVGEGRALNSIGHIYIFNGDYEEGADYCQRALKIAKGLKDSDLQEKCRENIEYAESLAKMGV